jgi:poly(A) polymerase
LEPEFLKAVETITPQGWMRSAESKAVMSALGEGNALFVGGCVRNVLLDEVVEDIDIATKLVPQDVMKRLEATAVKVVPTGIEHGTVTAVVEGKLFEITTLRKDVETDGRRAVVAFSEDWTEDARRRDFTMNALLMDMEGKVFDPLGCGLKDLQAHRVVFVGDPAERIAEDHLRILRYFRFHALYGQGEMDEAALGACRAAADKIPALSKERITQEFFKILSVDAPALVLQTMFENNILKEFFSPEYNPELLTQLCTFQKNYGLGFLASRLLVLAGFAEKNLKVLDEFLLIPRVFKKDIENLIQVLALPDLGEDHAVKVAIYKFGRVPTAQALMIELAQDRVMNGYAPKALDIIQNWDIPNFAVTGEDLIKKGIPQGPELGQELQRLEEEWIEHGFE